MPKRPASAIGTLRRHRVGAPVFCQSDRRDRQWVNGRDHVIGQEHREGRLAGQLAAQQHCLSRTAGPGFDEGQLHPPGERLGRVQARQALLVALFRQLTLQLRGRLEVGPNRLLHGRDDHDCGVEAGRLRLEERVVNQRPLAEQQQFLGHRPGKRKEPAAQAR